MTWLRMMTCAEGHRACAVRSLCTARRTQINRGSAQGGAGSAAHPRPPPPRCPAALHCATRSAAQLPPPTGNRSLSACVLSGPLLQRRVALALAPRHALAELYAHMGDPASACGQGGGGRGGRGGGGRGGAASTQPPRGPTGLRGLGMPRRHRATRQRSRPAAAAPAPVCVPHQALAPLSS